MIPFWGKNAEEKENNAIITIHVDGKKGHFFHRSWNYERNRLNKDLKKKNFKKDLMNLI